MTFSEIHQPQEAPGPIVGEVLDAYTDPDASEGDDHQLVPDSDYETGVVYTDPSEDHSYVEAGEESVIIEHEPIAADSGHETPRHHPNALGLDEVRLQQTAAEIRKNGLTTEQLTAITNARMAGGNPFVSYLISSAAGKVAEAGEDVTSFARGSVLALHLINVGSENGAPPMGLESLHLAAQYVGQHDVAALHAAAEGMLGSQVPLSSAFDEALGGLPEGTDYSTARFGGGIMLLGEMSAAQFGPNGAEAYDSFRQTTRT